MDLAHYRNSSSYLGSNDESFANKAVLTCAEVVSCTILADKCMARDTWSRLSNSIHHWYESLPSSFRPYFADNGPPHEDRQSAFPYMAMTRPAHGTTNGYTQYKF